MVTNLPKDNSRKGAVKGRSQVKNPKTGIWVKRDSTRGKFIDGKTSSKTPFKEYEKRNECRTYYGLMLIR